MPKPKVPKTPIQHDPALQRERAEIGARLALARQAAKLTQPEAATALADRSGRAIDYKAISAWETGRNMPDVHWLRLLSRVYEVTIDALLWDDDLSMEAVRIAKQFDALEPHEKPWARDVWTVTVSNAKTAARPQEAPSESPREQTRQRRADSRVTVALHQPDEAPKTTRARPRKG